MIYLAPAVGAAIQSKPAKASGNGTGSGSGNSAFGVRPEEISGAIGGVLLVGAIAGAAVFVFLSHVKGRSLTKVFGRSPKIGPAVYIRSAQLYGANLPTFVTPTAVSSLI